MSHNAATPPAFSNRDGAARSDAERPVAPQPATSSVDGFVD